MARKLGTPFFVMTLGFLAICIPILAHHGTAGAYDFPDGKILGGSQCNLGGGGVLVSTLPVKPGYTEVEVAMPKDDNKRPSSEQEQ